ncbi:uncharacterized protein LAJ45_10904 [Morchella importuna]|uniref:Cytochrome c oxidase assembly factor 3 n=1 Tax=Morchella conica CCBAS932 TaxID=1392247 RepID=A0A3N4LIE4_9PEZI|nr:uncharacterized protein LAJ45_10904 [Morchella importuna]KAH8145124.1 hypothetical protein LAJ45_10904 [Morchella importuna]RPB17695.1 hypothetical protein P167DRAFT_498375 [Morchella conica CCBAS932]
MIPTRRLLGPVAPRSSYYQSDYTQGPSLIRARKPFLVKNLLTGAAILALTGSIYLYTIKAVAQDNFEDVTVPDAPTQPAKTPNVGTSTITSGPLGK